VAEFNYATSGQRGDGLSNAPALQSRRDGGPCGFVEQALQALERRAEALRTIETFEAQVGNTPLRGRHVPGAGSVKHAVGVCDDGAGARGKRDEGAGEEGRGGGGHV
jgi:hypothetical protein